MIAQIYFYYLLLYLLLKLSNFVLLLNCWWVFPLKKKNPFFVSVTFLLRFALFFLFPLLCGVTLYLNGLIEGSSDAFYEVLS